jgi:hypothetical protein
MDLNGFNAAEVEPQQSLEPIPAGWYRAVITASEEKPTKAQTGSFLMLTLEVIEGQHQGRKVFDRLNLNNPNATAVEIAQGTLSSICRAVGVMTPRNSSDLHDKPFMVKLAVKPADGQYSASNDIKEYAAQDKAHAAAAAPAASSSTPPWKR